MSVVNSLQNIDKLNNENYESWKLQMRSILVCSDLWNQVNGNELKTETNATEWDKKDQKALAMIILNITQGQLNHVKNAETSNKAWNELKSIHESKGPVRKATLYKQLYRMKKTQDNSMTNYLNEFSSKTEQLKEAGIEIPDDLLSIMLLGSLPEEYENFAVAIESRDDIPSVSSLKIKLIEEEARQKERDGRFELDNVSSCNEALYTRNKQSNTKRFTQNTNRNYPQQEQSFNGKCYTCGKFGHRSSDCYINKRKEEPFPNANAMTAIACNVENTQSNIWCLDSAATRHMCNQKHKFAYLNENETTRVYTASDTYMNSQGVGEVNMDVNLNDKQSSKIILKNVIYIKELRNNLISVSQATKNGYKVIFDKDNAYIQKKDGTTVLRAEARNNLYVVSERSDSVFQTSEDSKIVERWHQRFGHLNVNDLKKLHTNNMVKGLQLNNKNTNFDCVICAKSKIHQLPYRISEHKEKERLGLVHSDICGPFEVQSLGGARYFATFIDDNSRYIETVMLRQRSDILIAFKNYKKRIEKQTGCVIKRLRTDNGKEYVSNEFKRLLEEEGISRQLTVEYTPQQNGVAERANRTLVEMARCMMLEAKLPKSLWAEMINTATYLRNRCPTKLLDNKTPHEIWFGEKPYIGFLRIIGSKVIALNKRNNRKKFDPKGIEYRLVGYSQESKAYRLWRPGTKTIIKARDVKFFEEMQNNEDINYQLNFEQEQTENNEENKNLPYVKTVKEDSKDNDPQDPSSEQEISMKNTEDTKEIFDTENSTEPNSENFYTDEYRNIENKRGRGRPKILRTGQRGKPKKIYVEKKTEETSQSEEDPTTVNEALDRNDADL